MAAFVRIHLLKLRTMDQNGVFGKAMAVWNFSGCV